MQFSPNYRAGVDAGFALLFAFVSRWPGTTQHGRWGALRIHCNEQA
jgi:hypothetical protein